MLLTVYCVRKDLSEVTFSLQVDADFELHNFRALCELESGIPAAESQIVYAERPLTDNHRSLASYGLKDGDVVILRQKENADPRPPVQFPGLPRIDFSSIAVPGTSTPQQQQQQQQQPQPAQHSRSSPADSASSPQGLDNPALLRDMLLANPHELSLLKERNPPLAEALLSGDLEKFTRVLVEQQQDRARREQERIRLFSADPFDLEAQAKIEEDIRQQNIEENMTIAMEEAPESFGQVVMLYINCKVNGHPVKAFVDSGAQMTIMSQACAERCNIMRLVDRRWAGIAKGVGTQKIIGRVHLAQVQIEGDFLPCSFSILEEQPMDMLLGLDMLKRHQCSIDLKKNVLVIGTTGTQTTFLPEGELPECARLAYGAGRDDMRPEEIADQELAEALQKSVEDAEKSDKETTSLGMSSLPTSDGFNCPAHSSGHGSRISNPTSLDRSVSAPASVCSHEPRLTEIIESKAAKALEASPELQITPEKKECSPPEQVLPGHVSLAEGAPATQASTSPAIALQNSLEETVVADNPEKSPEEKSSQDFEVHPDTEQKASLSTSTLGVPDPQMVLDEERQHLEHLEPSGENNLRQHINLKNEQLEVEQREPVDSDQLNTTEDLELPSVRQQSHTVVRQNSGDFPAETKGSQQQEINIPCPEESTPPASFDCSETLMEIDVVEHSLVTEHNLASRRKTDVKNVAASDFNLDNPWMEVEIAKLNSSSGVLSNLVTPPDFRFPESNVEMPATDTESPYLLDRGCSSSLNSSGLHQPSTEPPVPCEEPCVSVTAALKELHELLVVSCKETSKTPVRKEVPCHLETAVEDHANSEEASTQHPESEHLGADLEEQNLEGPSHQGIRGHGKAEKSIETPPGFEGVENDSLEGLDRRLTAPAEEVQKSPAFLRESSSVSLTSAETTDWPSCTLGEETSPGPSAGDGKPVNQTLEQFESFSSEIILVKDLHLATEHLLIGVPKTREDAAFPEAPPSPRDFDPPDSSVLPAPVFPSADVDRILRAGFTLQEALGALEQVGGNADLALLILLAKNIVVPTLPWKRRA
ncbi:regulatory solute carrier protein family 1 member 1 isoform X1 [Ornithorhynchus anatinus]|nr:regulatory solute carrier protein family 1 member 1 isoform X1 [Ornithorhynchus anatinus]